MSVLTHTIKNVTPNREGVATRTLHSGIRGMRRHPIMPAQQMKSRAGTVACS